VRKSKEVMKKWREETRYEEVKLCRVDVRMRRSEETV
jgi:hypothetical protein